MANYLLDIVILLTAAVVAVPLFRAAILIGPALALSSTAFVLQLLAEDGKPAETSDPTEV